MSEKMKIRLLTAVAGMKPAFWVASSKKAGKDPTGSECEERNGVIRKRSY
jgi:hypothetical protein